MPWTPAELDRLGAAEELEITGRRPDDSLRSWTPIWVVVVGEQVYVRTWHRRETGWFGRAVRTGRARVRVPGVEADVLVTDLGADLAGVRDDVDAAYRTKYARYGAAATGRMVDDDAAKATLRLDREHPPAG
ncbi:MAG TPA: DUF2255 family protein [Friedmanniella sp.]